jgi:Uma2 family endonuclease
MAENTEQFTWIVLIKENLEALFHDTPDVFVAGDLLWYPVEGQPEIARAPDALVVFGRPKGRRGSYRQWEEDNIPPQVVFEVLSPSNTLKELADKFEFYDLHGVEEYYLYDPQRNDLSGWLRQGGRLRVIEHIDGWRSPRLGIRFALTEETLHITRPDGHPFVSFTEMERRAAQEQSARQQAEARAAQAEARNARLAARLRELGIDPEDVNESSAC